MSIRNAFDNLTPDLQEKIGLKSPQIKRIYDKMDIEDIRKFGYKYCWGDIEKEIKIIDGRRYIVGLDIINKFYELIEKPECRCLSPSRDTINFIYYCIEKIIGDEVMLEKVMKKDYFRNAYNEHLDGKRLFVGMSFKNSYVLSILYYLYHYKLLYILGYFFYLRSSSKFDIRWVYHSISIDY